MNEFKIGDKVYFPHKTTKVLTICRNSYISEYPIIALADSVKYPWSLTIDGKVYVDDALPSLHHATPENQAKLEALYGVPFEPAPSKPTPKEIIHARLDSGELSVPCWVSSVDKQPDIRNTWIFIRQIVDEDQPFVDEQGSKWRYATPFNHVTLQPITELPVGE